MTTHEAARTILALRLSETQVETMLALFLLERGKFCTITSATLASELGCGRSAAHARLQALERKGACVIYQSGAALNAGVREALEVVRGAV